MPLPEYSGPDVAFCVDRSDTKLMLSSANDGDLLAWGSGGGVTDRIKVTDLPHFRQFSKGDEFDF